MFEKVGDIVGAGNEVGVGEMNGGNEVEVSIMVDLSVDDGTMERGIDEVEREDEPWATKVNITSPLLIFVSI